MMRKTMYTENSLKPYHSRVKANDVNRNRIDLGIVGNDLLILDQTEVFFDLWQSARSESFR